MGSEWLPSVLSEIVSIHTAKISVSEALLDSYISTDNMLPDFGGIENATKLPSSGKVTAFKKGDILFSNIRTYFKKLWLADYNGSCSNDVIVFRPKVDIEAGYVFHLLMDEEFIEYTVKTSKGTKMPRGDKDAIMKYQFRLAPEKFRKSISDTLLSFKIKIELNRQTNQTLEQMAQTLFKSWFVDFDPVFDNALLKSGVTTQKSHSDADDQQLLASFPEALRPKAKQRLNVLRSRTSMYEGTQERHSNEGQKLGNEAFPSEFEFNEQLGWIPKGWECSDIDEITSLIIDHRGKTPKKLGGDWSENGVPAISAKNIKSGRLARKDTIRYVNDDMYKKWMKQPLQSEDIAMTSEAPLGELYFFAENHKYLLSQRLYGIRADKTKCSGSYLYFWLQSDFARSDLDGRATGTTVVGIRQSELRKVSVLSPSKSALDLFSPIANEYLQKIEKNEQNNTTLTKLRDTLLPKLISGELQIPDTKLSASSFPNNA